EAGKVVTCNPVREPLLQEVAHGTDDLVPTAITHSDVDVHPGDARGELLSRPQAIGDRLREQTQIPNHLQWPAPGLSKARNSIGDDLQECTDLLLIPPE